MQTLSGSFEYLMKGGLMMIPLLISAFVGLVVIIERFYRLHGDYSAPANVVSRVVELVRRREFEQATELCRVSETPVTSVLRAGIANFDASLEEMELCMKNQAEEWIPRLEKRIEVIDTIITAAPLMGLLGTITGMMASFRVLTEKGVNEPNAITGGVAEALIATATGLVIALLCLVAYNYLSARVRVYIYEVESAASRLIEAKRFAERGALSSSKVHGK